MKPKKMAKSETKHVVNETDQNKNKHIRPKPVVNDFAESTPPPLLIKKAKIVNRAVIFVGEEG